MLPCIAGGLARENFLVALPSDQGVCWGALLGLFTSYAALHSGSYQTHVAPFKFAFPPRNLCPMRLGPGLPTRDALDSQLMKLQACSIPTITALNRNPISLC